MEIPREVFEEQRNPRYGTTNPERMQLAFWGWMIRGDELPEPDTNLPDPFGLTGDGGKLKSIYGPWRARKLFQAPTSDEKGPIWTFHERMGRTCTKLSDGRIICIGGEHEDWYDPDFYIYNDVVVFGPGGEIEIYGYPREVFPPTDFHTASVVDNSIVIVGCLGYKKDRRPGFTPVYSLDLSNYRISEMATTAESPGWIFKHQAEVRQDGDITIRGGEVYEERNGEQRFRRNIQDFALDAKSGAWRRLTYRMKFSIRQADSRHFDSGKRLPADHLIPNEIERAVESYKDWRHLQIVVNGVKVSVTIEAREIDVTIEDELPADLVWRMTAGIRVNAEKILEQPCVLEVV